MCCSSKQGTWREALRLLQRQARCHVLCHSHDAAAVGFSAMQVVSVLLTAGADVRVSNDFGNTPLHMARSSQVKDLIVRMTTGGPDIRSQIQQEMRLQHEQSINQRAKARQEAQLE